MNAAKHFQFIRDKMADINIALLHCYTRSLLTIPTTVINTFKVDDEGNIFIFMPRPKQLLSQFEKEFPVDLNYLKKGASHFINVYGRARIIDDPEELICYNLTSGEMEKALNSQMLLIVKMYKADYHEKTITNKALLQKIKSVVFNVLHLNEGRERTYDFTAFNHIHAHNFKVLN